MATRSARTSPTTRRSPRRRTDPTSWCDRRTARQVSAVVSLAAELGVPVTARGSGTGLSGACIPRHGGILVSFERMAEILEIDLENHVAVVQPGVPSTNSTPPLAEHGLVYPVFPGENSASLGGNVATNAGGMRAVKYGVTRHQVLGIEAVLGTGEVIRSGGKFVKSTSGYDLTQLVVGSEGTLAVVTEATLRLYPRPAHTATVLAPFATMEVIAEAVPRIVASGVGPMILEYIDIVAMAGIEAASGIEIGVGPETSGPRRSPTWSWCSRTAPTSVSTRTPRSWPRCWASWGRIDVYVLPPGSGAALIEAREKVFWAAKANGADDIIDMVVPRASIPAYLAKVAELAQASASFIPGCGHAGDGNVHLSIFQPDPEVRHRVLHDLFAAGVAMGGAISGEHGIGSEKRSYLHDLEDPAKLALMAPDQDGVRPARHPQPRRDLGQRGDRPVNGAQALIRTLVASGVDVCFTNPGTSEMHFVAALDDVPEMRGVLALFEGVATGAADGYGRMAERPAATLLHLGPGLGNGLANLHNARRAHTPIVNIVGDHATGPPALRRPTPVRHRDRRPERVDMDQVVGLIRRGGRRCRRGRGGGCRPARSDRHAGAARRRVVDRRRRTGAASCAHAADGPGPDHHRRRRRRHYARVSRPRCSSGDGPSAARPSSTRPASRPPPAPSSSARRSPPAWNAVPVGPRSNVSPTSPSSPSCR